MEEQIFNSLLTQGPFALLFVWLLFSTKKEGRERETRLVKQAEERETKLMDHNERMVIQLERNTGTLQQIERSLNGLENELQELKEKVG
ncbi:BhlA/UviB family holin-like peptide [Brevibacillus laterosporus]|uniref:BhlA/UviB family holin-like peptide n=1 Tax=Brevibacillus laterosporus TaxID=1465 RepID=A0AAP3DKE8_BRELA|nr:BhlA/UviB family holin-like peptide [Brevibacillus laterosporus]ATO50158.1 bacteriocin uviB [Brevibacillus laterosporus DSM 25]MCR8982582.1 BhlA/UviB family holin-like peptide [Brevibacillus laterosporus]MCZ0809738.1 BhlA/UviB family holin-like peptide [Brevibacillus laterosporus]MCZ0828332.1 BhlA/UviB family holin-like peptide [Brevibacillus laterosporus]MCZ0851398.1 BhlA/UviB family holin-like peptide [Brevibacillus laterosporus]